MGIDPKQLKPGQESQVVATLNGRVAWSSGFAGPAGRDALVTEVWMWGRNNRGALGDNSTTDRSSPVSLVGSHQFVAFATGAIGSSYSHSVGLKQDGTMWGWGNGSGGELGDNTATNRSSPVSAVGHHKFADLAAGGLHSLGRKPDGTVWSCGQNNYGQVGDNSSGGAAWKSSPVSVVGNHIFIKISTGAFFSNALKSDGSAWSWGRNGDGQIGDNSASNRSSPVSVVGAHSFIAIHSGGRHAVALKSDGSAWGWGLGTEGQLGQHSVIVSRSSPVSAVGEHSFTKVTGGGYHTAGLKSDGTVWTWGYNNVGQIGNNLGTPRSSPVSVVGGHSFIDINSSLGNTFGLKSDGTVWGWGWNVYGQLGDGTASNRSSPVSLVGNHSFKTLALFGDAVASGALKNFGIPGVTLTGATGPRGAEPPNTLWLWGRNNFGQLGQNTTTDRSSPVSVISGINFAKFSTGTFHTLALDAGGVPWGWGHNTFGAVGDASYTHRSSPVAIYGGHRFVQVVGFLYCSFARKETDGSAWAWGLNNNGQLGDNTVNVRTFPGQPVGSHSFIQIAPMSGLKADGAVWAWGVNNYGQVGDNSATNRSSPVSVVGNHSFIFLDANNVNKFGLKSDGSAWGWGLGYIGTLGDGDSSTHFRSSPVSVVGNHSFVKLAIGNSHTFGLKSDGTVWGWGRNAGSGAGALGDNTTTNRNSPVSVVGNHSFVDVAGVGYGGVARKVDGSTWTWGVNTYGAVGDNTVTSRSSPVSVVGSHVFAAIPMLAGGHGFSLAGGLKTVAGISGPPGSTGATGPAGTGFVPLTLWQWGRNQYGQLGDNTVNHKSSPVSTIGHFRFKEFGADLHVVALDYNGNAWSWGWDIAGQLGQGSVSGVNRSSPISVVGNHVFAHAFAGLATSFGLKSDGTAWAWGYNVLGAVGDNTANGRSSPVSVVGNHSFKFLSQAAGLKADGSIWAWNGNADGAVGDNTTTNRSSPVSVVGAHSFIQMNTGPLNRIALKSDGSAWAWGFGTSGQTGDNTVTSKSSPVSVVGNHAFAKVIFGQYHAVGLKSDGSVWSWGRNVYGQIGDNSTTARSSPVSVVGAHSFIDITSDKEGSAGLKDNGQVWAWGNNTYGQVGDNSTTHRSSPVSVVGSMFFNKFDFNVTGRGQNLGALRYVNALGGIVSDTLNIFTALSNMPPAASFATSDTRNAHVVLDFDDTTAESAMFCSILPRRYGGSGLTVTIVWMATTATTGNVVWSAAFERHDDSGTDLDSDSFATAKTVTSSAPSTSGAARYASVSFSNSEIDGLLVGESFRLRVRRDAADGSDTMSGDAELLRVEIKET